MRFEQLSFVFQVAFESELRFGSRSDENEEELKKVLLIVSKILKFSDPSFVTIEACLPQRLA